MKRLIAIMLCVISLLSVLPTAAFAAVKEVDPETANTAEDANAAERESEPQRGPVEFWDVRPGDWFYNAVMWAKTNGITSGVRPGEFGPNYKVNRAQVVTFLYAYKGKPDVTNMTNPFCDVDDNAYYRDAAVWAYNNKYSLGSVDWCGNRSFMPDKVCTFPEIITMLYAMAGKPSVTGWTNPYSNVNGAYYRNAAVWSYYREIARFIGTGKKGPEIVPVDDEKLFPTYECDRATTVTLLYAFAVEEMVIHAESEYSEESYDWMGGGRYGRGGSDWCAAFVSWCAMRTCLADKTGVTFYSDDSTGWWDDVNPNSSYNYPVLRNDTAYYVAQQFVDNNKGTLFMSQYAYSTNSQYTNEANNGEEQNLPLGEKAEFKNATVYSNSFVPRRGDIIFFGTKEYSISHVGIVTGCELVTKWGKEYAEITTVEGNSGNNTVVTETYYLDMAGDGHYKDDKWIVGFGRIK